MWLSLAFKNNVIQLEVMEIYTSAMNTGLEQPSKLPFVRIKLSFKQLILLLIFLYKTLQKCFLTYPEISWKSETFTKVVIFCYFSLES